jgi:hypothetical protein
LELGEDSRASQAEPSKKNGENWLELLKNIVSLMPALLPLLEKELRFYQ